METSLETPLDQVWRSRARSLLTREPHGAHLPDEAWVALAEGRAVPGAASGALEHLARCAECRDILRAVHLLKAARPSTDTVEPPAEPSRWAWAATLAAMLVAGGGVWMVMPSRPAADVAIARAPGAPVPPASSSPAAPASPSWLRIAPPAVAIYSPGVLTMRGGDAGRFADAFADALAPWQAGRYREVARRLDVITAAHPAVAEGHFYKGTALLLDGAAAQAVAPLERAVALAPVALAPDASWYLGLALHQSGQRAQAWRAFAAACRAGRPLACEAAADAGRAAVTRP